MFKRKTMRFFCLMLCLCLISEAFLVNLLPINQTCAETQAEPFSPSEALSPGEYLANIKKLLGANRQEIEEQSYGQWMMLMTNILIMLDPKATDVMTLQHAIGKSLDTIEKIRGISENIPKYIKKIEKISSFGCRFFPRSNSPKMYNLFLKVNNAMKSLGQKQAIIDLGQGAKYMKSPYSRGNHAFKQWYKKGTPLLDGSQQLSPLQSGAMKVGSVLQVVAGTIEMKRFFGALGDDAGTPGFETVQMGISGAILIASALVLWPPPGAWAAAAYIVIGAWEIIKNTLNSVGAQIEKWHKCYADSLTFLRETDDEFRAFFEENNANTDSAQNSELIDPLERSAALVFADELQQALNEEPSEGDIAQRQQDLVKNIRAQGIVSTWYYQQSEAARKLPANIEDLYTIWNHRADYMAWKPKKPRWSWNPISLVGDSLSWAGNTVMEEILGTHDQIESDMKNYPDMALFCPDFALMILFRNYVTSTVKGQANEELPEIISLTGVRIEQSPFNYMPLIEVYNNDFNNWNDEIFGQALAADSILVAAKELPYLVEQLKFSLKNNETSTMLTLAKIMGIQVLGENPEISAHEMVLELYKKGVKKQLECGARARAQLNALVEAYENSPQENIKDLKVEYSFDDDNHDFKLFKELFIGKKIFSGDFDFDSGILTPEVWSAILRGEEYPEDAPETAEFILGNYSEQIQTCLQLNLNSTGISGVDLVKLGIQLKNEIDILELAKDSLADKRKAVDERDEVLTENAFKTLVNKGEFLDVKRSSISNFLSSFDPPIDLVKHHNGKLEDVIEDLEKSIERRLEVVRELRDLVKSEYVKWLTTYRKYERLSEELGLNLEIDSSQRNYAPENLDFLSDFVALDPAAELE